MVEERGDGEALDRGRDVLFEAGQGLVDDGLLDGRQQRKLAKGVDAGDAVFDLAAFAVGHRAEGALHLERLEGFRRRRRLAVLSPFGLFAV